MQDCFSHYRSLRPLAGLPSNVAILVLAAFVVLAANTYAATVRDAEKLSRNGKYEECIELAKAEIDRGIRLEQWRHVKAEAELNLGRYEDALATVDEGLESYPISIQMRLLASRVYRFNNKPAAADAQLDFIEQIVRSRPRRHSSPDDLIALGEYLLARGADARQVLELCFDPVVDQHPEYVEGHLASARLALDKYDNGLAAEILNSAPQAARESAEFQHLLARAYKADNPSRATDALDKALEINPRHVDSLLMQAENLIDGEQFEDAKKLLAEVRKVNPEHPIAWAYSAVLANLLGDEEEETSAREVALSNWPQNPEVDYTIGKKLSDKYRFAEGAAYQRRALSMDAEYLPARVQLAQDLLRLGREEEGWQLIHEVSSNDGYNVVAHNLVTLHDSLEKYRVLSTDSFRVRMEAREADIYGQRVLDVLTDAKDVLCNKYEVTIDEPVIVDIFPSKNDFAVRTFGLPGADGFLGVCFGNVITANSPAALGSTTANWEAVLWHEFCHVVTLSKSQNKMPRWLSEGISVYEELQRDPTWGQQMTPVYRTMIIDGEMARLSELSSMFLSPKSALHLQFAYYESAMAVQYIIDNHGIETVKLLLDELADGASINEALIRHVAPLGELDGEFEDFMIQRAKNLAPEIDWEPMSLGPATDATTIAAWLKDHPDNFYGLTRLAQAHLRDEEWQQMIEPARRLRELYPDFVGENNPYQLLATAYRELGQLNEEREALEAWSERSADAVDAYFRLMEIGENAQDWQLVKTNAQRVLAVDPLSPIPHRYLAKASEELEHADDAISAYRALLHFDTSDPVNTHYRLANLLHEEKQHDEARRHVLMALEDAPRFLAAHRLLLELTGLGKAGDAPASDQEQPQ